MSTNLADLDAGALLALFARGDATPSDALAACHARMDAREPIVHAFRTRTDDLARDSAAHSDAAWKAGRARPLEGIPLAVKDIIDTEGILTTLGTAEERYRMPERDATVVERLLDAGCVLIGKSTVSEFAFGDAREDHRSTNPWNAERWTGGSSVGSGAALAAREVPIALGTDTGGSIRVPSAYCGVTGLKPTFGRVPADGVAQVSWTLDHAGPMARAADDLARMFAVIAGQADADPASHGGAFVDAPTTDPTDLRGLRIGIPTNWFLDDTDPRILDAFDAATDTLVALGATRHDVHVEHAELAGIISWVITVAEFAANRECDLDRLDRLTNSAVNRLVGGRAVSAPDYLRALRARHLVQRSLDAVFDSVDVLLTPATPSLPPRIGLPVDSLWAGGDASWLDGIARNYLIANITGVPAMAMPSGLVDGLPVGVQVIAPPCAEDRCFRVGRAFQAATTHHEAVPPLPA